MPAPSPVAKIGDLAAAAGIRRVHLLSWRDLDDVEAGGSEIHAARVASAWAEAGIEVLWRSSYAQGHPHRATRDGYDVLRRAGRYLVFPRAVAAELAGHHGKADALVEIWNGMPFFSPLWSRLPKIVMLHHVHAEMWQMVLGEEAPLLATLGDVLERRVAPLAYRRARIVTPSESAKAEIVSMLNLRPEWVTVVHNGVDAAFTPGGERAAEPTVLAVGRLVPVKRHDLLVRAVAEARRTVPDLRLTLVGEGYDRVVIEAAVRDVGGEEWVTFAGRVSQDELVRLYRQAWLVASASAREGWGLALSEAAACGTPAVATRIAGHVDAVADGESALLVPGTAADLGAAIARVASDAGLRARLGAAALARGARLTWDATALGLMEALAGDASRRCRTASTS